MQFPDTPCIKRVYKKKSAVQVVASDEQRALFIPIPGHALHEKGFQRQIGVGTLINSQQRRALAVPVINRG